MLLDGYHPTYGNTLEFAPSPAQGSGPAIVPGPGARGTAKGQGIQVGNDFETLVGIVRINERLFADLHALNVKLRQARAYLAEAGCNRSLGYANLSHLRTKRSGTLALLRTNRLEAWEILARVGPNGGAEVGDPRAQSSRRPSAEAPRAADSP
jgi:hypothetical protein